MSTTARRCDQPYKLFVMSAAGPYRPRFHTGKMTRVYAALGAMSRRLANRTWSGRKAKSVMGMRGAKMVAIAVCR
jgi:hypothetical protein